MRLDDIFAVGDLRVHRASPGNGLTGLQVYQIGGQLGGADIHRESDVRRAEDGRMEIQLRILPIQLQTLGSRGLGECTISRRSGSAWHAKQNPEDRSAPSGGLFNQGGRGEPAGNQTHPALLTRANPATDGCQSHPGRLGGLQEGLAGAGLGAPSERFKVDTERLRHGDTGRSLSGCKPHTHPSEPWQVQDQRKDTDFLGSIMPPEVSWIPARAGSSRE